VPFSLLFTFPESVFDAMFGLINGKTLFPEPKKNENEKKYIVKVAVMEFPICGVCLYFLGWSG
jgi:hypothetical protein